jgi:ethanolamine utilization protein EutQ (cupin superfamily)
MTEMKTPRVSKPDYRAAEDRVFGTANIEHRTAGCGLTELGTYFMVFSDETPTEPWTLHYEETIFVIEGQARMTVIEGDKEHQMIANPGELLVLQNGSTVRYAAAAGTTLLLSISPVNWRDRLKHFD